ncbi:hypothetical protein [Clostridium frigidicarnis]|uniref:Uncharacterized protein n=1 Tax=Clostridium frigidicarnis TaxID=84698 RepID=A0A1I1B1Y1_9CLOT|nr:hypothetical protein [Clostridium frigidicarnis]SFB44354.1 hypothetical protein SAMN04488528_105810 [Clostridium frigidicarnis]
MKKILSTILLSLLIFIFIFIDSQSSPDSKNIILGIYIIFPIIFIIQGIISSNSIKTMLIGLLLSSISVMIPICMWYNMDSMIVPVIIYNLLGILVFFKRYGKSHERK